MYFIFLFYYGTADFLRAGTRAAERAGREDLYAASGRVRDLDGDVGPLPDPVQA